MQHKKIIKKVFLFVILFTTGSGLYAQPDSKVDSLRSLIEKSKEDTTKINLLNALSAHLGHTNKMEEAIQYASQSIILSKKLNFKRGEGLSYYLLGTIAWRKANYPDALKNFLLSLKLREEINDKSGIAHSHNVIGVIYIEQGKYSEALKTFAVTLEHFKALGKKRDIAGAYSNIGSVHEQQGNYSEALKNHQYSLKLREEVGEKQGIAASYNNLGVVNERQGNNSEALKYHLAALKIREGTNNKHGIATSYTNIGNIYGNEEKYADALKMFQSAIKIYEELNYKPGIAGIYHNIGEIYKKQGNYTAAMKNFTQSLNMRLEIGDKKGMANSYNTIGLLFTKDANYPEALQNLLSAVKISEEIGDKSGIATSYINLGELKIKMNQHNAGKKYFQDGLAIAKSIGNKNIIKEAYNNLSELENTQGNYKAAYGNYKMYILYRDSILNNTNSRKILSQQIQYEFEKKEDSLKWQQQLAEIKLKDQVLLTEQQKQAADAKMKEQVLLAQQQQHTADERSKVQLLLINQHQQTLLLNKSELSLATQKELLQKLELEKSQADFASEKSERVAETKIKQGQLLLLNKENAIQLLELTKQNLFKRYLIAGFIVLAALFFLAYRNYRIRQNLKIQTLRNKIASDLHDDVGSTLSSISIYCQMAQQQSKEVIPMLETIGESSRKMLDAMADIVWTINTENDEFEKIILRMRGFAYELLGAKGIDFEFVADEQIEKVNLPMNVRKNLYLIFKEATNNMAKYSGADKALFSITEKKNSLVMLIQDNGKGFNASLPAEGNGLKNMKKRAEEIGAKLFINSDFGKGTTLLINLAV